MYMIKEVILYAVILTLVDYLYLSNVSHLYNKLMLKIQGSKLEFKLVPAIVVYVSLVASWVYFIYPTLGKKTLKESCIDAAVLGFVIYSVYDFTNMATIKDWRLDLAVMDSFWGAILYALSTFIYVKSSRLLF